MRVYILYSSKIDKYYIGQTELLAIERLDQHNSTFYDKSFTKNGIPWELYFELECKSKKQAIQIENHIKKMKSRLYIQNLKRYPEISIKLLNEYR